MIIEQSFGGPKITKGVFLVFNDFTFVVANCAPCPQTVSPSQSLSLSKISLRTWVLGKTRSS